MPATTSTRRPARWSRRSISRRRSSAPPTAAIRTATSIRATTTRTATASRRRSPRSRAVPPARRSRPGLAAVTAIFQGLQPGDHVVAPLDIYHGTANVLKHLFAKWQVGASFVDMTRLDDIARAMQPRTRIVWIETPSNPLLQCVDIGAVAELAHRSGARAVADNTFASPALQRPLDLGCDLVMHATTKYLGGRSDVMGGAVVARVDDEAFAARAHGAALRRRGAVAVRLLAGDAQPADAGLPHARALRQRGAGSRRSCTTIPRSRRSTTRVSRAIRSMPSRSGRCRTSAACCRSRPAAARTRR